MNNVNYSGRISKITPANRGDKEFCYVTIARNNGKTKDGKDIPADFISFQAWGNNAQFLKQYCAVGEHIAVEAHLKMNNYEKDGQKRSELIVVIDEIDRGDKRGTNAAPAPEETNTSEEIDISNDDLPF